MIILVKIAIGFLKWNRKVFSAAAAPSSGTIQVLFLMKTKIKEIYTYSLLSDAYNGKAEAYGIYVLS